jgi:uncharacterized protein
MAQKRNRKNISFAISPFIWGYLVSLEHQGVPLERVYLFGSWAKGTQHKDSDIDLAIISSKFKTWSKKTRLLSKAMRMDFSAVEPHGFHPKDFVKENPVVDEILKYGIRIV